MPGTIRVRRSHKCIECGSAIEMEHVLQHARSDKDLPRRQQLLDVLLRAVLRIREQKCLDCASPEANRIVKQLRLTAGDMQTVPQLLGALEWLSKTHPRYGVKIGMEEKKNTDQRTLIQLPQEVLNFFITTPVMMAQILGKFDVLSSELRGLRDEIKQLRESVDEMSMCDCEEEEEEAEDAEDPTD